jgi:DNA polymerase-3 subunit epsilon
MTGFDLETTGVDPFTERPVSFALVRFEGDLVRGVEAHLVNPGVPIPAEATAVHGISDADVGPGSRAWRLDDTMAWIAGLLAGTSSRGTPIVGMNLAFDLTMVRECLRRADLLAAWIQPRYVVDLMVLDKHVDRYRKGSRTLSSLCEVYGVELGEDAHDARADVVASVRCLRALAARYPEVGEMALGELTVHQATWNREQKESLSGYFESRGMAGLPPWSLEWPTYAERDPNYRTCRLCGCTDDYACVGGCSWISADVCSSHVVALDGARL